MKKIFLLLVCSFVLFGCSGEVEEPKETVSTIIQKIEKDAQIKEEDKTLNVYFNVEYTVNALGTKQKYFSVISKMVQALKETTYIYQYDQIKFTGNIKNGEKNIGKTSGSLTTKAIKEQSSFIGVDWEKSLNDFFFPNTIK